MTDCVITSMFREFYGTVPLIIIIMIILIIIIIITIIIIISLFYIATISIMFKTALHDLNIYTHKLQE